MLGHTYPSQLPALKWPCIFFPEVFLTLLSLDPFFGIHLLQTSIFRLRLLR